jgi:hypothetical protein
MIEKDSLRSRKRTRTDDQEVKKKKKKVILNGYMENLEPNGIEWSGMKNIPWNINNMEWNINNMEWNIKKHGME